MGRGRRKRRRRRVEGGPEKEKKRRETRVKEGGKSEEAMVSGTTGKSEKDGKRRERAAVRPSELDI